jgi:hypothetical protein
MMLPNPSHCRATPTEAKTFAQLQFGDKVNAVQRWPAQPFKEDTKMAIHFTVFSNTPY